MGGQRGRKKGGTFFHRKISSVVPVSSLLSEKGEQQRYCRLSSAALLMCLLCWLLCGLEFTCWFACFVICP